MTIARRRRTEEIKDNENRVAHAARRGRRAGPPRAPGAGRRPVPAPDRASATTNTPPPAPPSSPTADEVFAGADLIVKVKEPIPAEYHRFRKGQQLFTYLHLAADRELTDFLLDRQIDSIAYETVQTAGPATPAAHPDERGRRPLAVQAAAHHLESPAGGAGLLLGGVPGTPAAKVTIIGGGVAGTEAAKIAVGMRAIVRVFDTNPAPAGIPVRHLRGPARPRHPQPGPARRLRRRFRRRHRRCAGPRRQGAEAGHPRDDRQHAAGQRRRRHRHRPGRLLRDQPRPPRIPTRPTSRRASSTTASRTSPARSPAPRRWR